MNYIVKIAITAVMVVLVAEVSKRNLLAGGILASLPLTSVLAMIWLYHDTKNTAQVAALAGSILWLVLPSLLLFIVLPWLLSRHMPFYPALGLSCLATIAGYFATLKLLALFKIQG